MQHSYAPIGKPDEIKCDCKNKQYVSVSGVISPDGFSYFEVRIQESFKQKGLTRFLENAWASCSKNLLVVWDNAPSHKSKTVKEFLSKQNSENAMIWLENTPAYSPELNPIELVWSYLKSELANQFVRNTYKLRKMVVDVLDKLQKDIPLIQSFFRHKELECYDFFS